MIKKLRENPALPLITLIFLSFIWGSSFILIKKGLEAFSPTQVGTIRISFAFLALSPIGIRYFKKYYVGRWKIFLIYGLIANLFPAVLFALAETGLSSSLTGILNSLTPLFTLIIGALIFSIAINKGQVAGLAIGLIGSLVLSFVGAEGALGEFNFYALFVILATICYGISANMVKAYFPDVNSVILTSMAMLSVGPISLIYLFSTDFLTRMSTIETAWTSLGYLFILGVVGTSFALILFNRVIQTTSAVFASTVTYLIPIFAVFWGVIDGESLFLLHFLGMALIISGVFLVKKN